MFYCDHCANQQVWPVTKAEARSMSRCGLCNEKTYCNEKPATELPERISVNFSHVARMEDGDLVIGVCMDCKGQVRSCPDPVCEEQREVHHIEETAGPNCPFSIKVERSTDRPLTRRELIAYVDYCRRNNDRLRTELAAIRHKK